MVICIELMCLLSNVLMKDDVLTPLWVASTFTSAWFSGQCCARWCKQGRLVEGACHHHRLFAHFLPDCSVRIIRTPTRSSANPRKTTKTNPHQEHVILVLIWHRPRFRICWWWICNVLAFASFLIFFAKLNKFVTFWAFSEIKLAILFFLCFTFFHC